MNRTILSIFAALTLVAAVPAMAQQDDSRTNPNAGNITSESGLTITGSVVESNDEQLTLKTTTGIQHIQIVSNTQSPVELTVGQNVSVDYTRTSQGVMIASKIRTEGTEPMVEETVATTTGTESMDTDAMDESMDSSATADLDADADMDTTMRDQDTLPATGSALPLFGLLGLVSVGAAVGLRSIR